MSARGRGLACAAAAMVLAVPAVAHAEPHWYQGSSMLGATPLLMTGNDGHMSFAVTLGPQKNRVIKCAKAGVLEVAIWNPVPSLTGPAGEDEVLAWNLTSCKERVHQTAKLCPSSGEKVQVLGQDLDWPSHLAIDSKIVDEIEDVTFETKCTGTSLAKEAFTGTLKPRIEPGKLDFLQPPTTALRNQASDPVIVEGRYNTHPGTISAKNP